MEGGYFYNIMFRSIVIFLLFILFKQVIFSQENFQKIYLFEDTFALFNDIHVTDSCFYFGAASGKGSERCDITFGKLKLNGDVDFFNKAITPNEYNFNYSGRTQLDTNFRGNFMFGYSNEIYGIGFLPQITEINSNGVIENDFYLDFFIDDSLRTFVEGRILNSNIDSSYYLYFTYTDISIANDENGVIFGKLKYNGDTLWTKRFYNQTSSYLIQLVVSEISLLENGNLLLTMTEVYDHAPASAEQDWAKLHFYIVDSNGNIESHKVFQDSQYCFGSFGVLPLSDGSVIVSYFDSRISGSPPNSDYFISRPVIARIDSNCQLIWKDTLMNGYWNLSFYSNPNKFVLKDDTIFSGAYSWSWSTENSIDSVDSWSNFRAFNTVRIFNQHINGARLWNRDFIYWYPSDSINEPEYEMRDFELTADGGFITCGNVKHFDSINIGSPAQFGYILKTNCLGFLDDPQTSASYSYKDSFKLEFVNSSIQAGSYQWIFGDGDTLNTSEYIDTIYHQFPTMGEYSVKLIGYGCNGASDTTEFMIDVPDLPEDSVYYSGDETMLTFYPNPTSTGESIAFYVGKLPQEKVIFELNNELGQIVHQGNIPQGETTYILPKQFAIGVYFGTLRTETVRLETEKLIVK